MYRDGDKHYIGCYFYRAKQNSYTDDVGERSERGGEQKKSTGKNTFRSNMAVNGKTPIKCI